MAASVGLLTLHGMGGAQHGYAAELLAALSSRLGSAWDRVAVETVLYQEAIQGRQEQIFERMRPHVDWHGLRRFLLYSFSDAATLEHRPGEPGSPYHEAQRTIRDALDRMFDALGGLPRPVVVVAHSLGCQVISNYVWDAQKPGAASRGVFAAPDPNVPRGSDRDAFRRLRTMRLLATTGCNIALFVAGRSRIVPFAPPNGDFAWRNYYDEDDALGWPLRPLYDESGEIVTDVAVNAAGGLAGALTAAWNPLSHLNYWTDGEVVGPIAEALAELA